MTPREAAAVLNVPVAASEAEIRAAYRVHARASHPDRFVDGSARVRSEASARFIRVGEAQEAMLRELHSPEPSWAYPDQPVPRGTTRPAPSPRQRDAADPPLNYVRWPADRTPASPRLRAFWRWMVIVFATMLALLFSSNFVGLAPENFGIGQRGVESLIFRIGAETLCVAAAISCAVFAATGRQRAERIAGILTGTVLAATFVADLALAPFTISTLFLAGFGTAVAAGPFVALFLLGRSRGGRLPRR